MGGGRTHVEAGASGFSCHFSSHSALLKFPLLLLLPLLIPLLLLAVTV